MHVIQHVFPELHTDILIADTVVIKYIRLLCCVTYTGRSFIGCGCGCCSGGGGGGTSVSCACLREKVKQRHFSCCSVQCLFFLLFLLIKAFCDKFCLVQL